jgi:NADH-quinone oxidoreductase subunit A
MQPVPVPQIASLSPWEPGLPALFVYAFLILGLIGLLLFLAVRLGEKKDSVEKRRPYECGIIPSGPAGFSFPVPFYLSAVFFLIFDVEAAFILAWAIAFTDLGWTGWLQISVFIILLLAGLVYIWNKRGLEWVHHFETFRSDQK